MTGETTATAYFRSNYSSVSHFPRNGGDAEASGGTASTAFSDLLQGSGNDVSEGRLPVEMYAIPNWYADYGFQVPNQLGAGGNWFAERYPEAAAASQGERDEYSALVRKHYDELLDANGLHDTISHYDAMIRDPQKSDQMRREMAERVEGDPRLMELMKLMGKTVA